MRRAWILFFLIEEGFALAQRTKDSPSEHGGQSPNQNDCGTWVRNINGGVFTSPNYPTTYPPNKECVYILEALPRQRIQLAFDKNYYIEPSFECRFDHIEIRDGPFGFSPLIDRFCGGKNPGLVTSTGRFMWIKFTSDEELEGLGFRIKYTFIADPDFHLHVGGLLNPIPDCQFEIGGWDGVIRSSQVEEEERVKPGDALDCIWTIRAPPQSKIYLRFMEYQMEHSNECKKNFVAVYDGSSAIENLKAKFCSTVANDVMLDNGVGVVRMWADEKSRLSRFRMLFTSFVDHHKNGHYIIPQMADRARPKCPTQSLDLSELAKAAKKKLQALNNRLFEELAMDVYDEVDRRENDAVWLTTQNHSTLVTERSAVPFLPVNPEYSATRNQGRQKLARFNAREFATLIIDILSDAKRRQQGKGLSSPTDPLDLGIDDDQHDYDSVASDEDTDSELTTQNNNNTQRSNRAKSMDSSDLSDGPITLQEYLEVKKALASSEAKVQQLMKVNNNLSEELRRLQKEITRMQTENSALRGGQQAGGAAGHGVGGPGGGGGGGGGGHWQGGGMRIGISGGGLVGFGTGADPPGLSVPSSVAPNSHPHRRDRQAFSMYEPGAAPGPTAHGPPVLDSLAARLQPLNTHSVRRGGTGGPAPYGGHHLSGSTEMGRYMVPRSEKHGSGTDSDYDNTQTYDLSLSMGRSSEDSEEGGGGEAVEPDPTLPCTEDVIMKTEQVTKNIQELLRAAQEFKHDSFVPCSEKIHSAVTEMASLFPKRPALDAVHCSLRLLASSASRLQVECRKAAPSEPGGPAVDYQLLTQQVIQCAYDIAKAAKQLVTITTREKKQ